jgi:hypothetical protein
VAGAINNHKNQQIQAIRRETRDPARPVKDKPMRHLLPLFCLALFTAPLPAQVAAPVPPSMPEQAETSDAPPQAQDQELQPEVTIIQRDGAAIEEYRVGGQLYMVKITPSKGLPYYLVDSDGDGVLETRRNELDNPEVVKWRIFSW